MSRYVRQLAVINPVILLVEKLVPKLNNPAFKYVIKLLPARQQCYDKFATQAERVLSKQIQRYPTP